MPYGQTAVTITLPAIVSVGVVWPPVAGVLGYLGSIEFFDASTGLSVDVPVSVSFAVSSQTITFGALTNVALGFAPFTISATASSGLTVAFASTTPSVCTVSGDIVTIVAAGTCSITASQAGNSSYAAAAGVTQSFTVSSAAIYSNLTAAVPGAGFRTAGGSVPCLLPSAASPVGPHPMPPNSHRS